jgi:hypothetical protein
MLAPSNRDARVTPSPIQELPKLGEPVAGDGDGEGGGGEDAAVEEEFDLSDIMAEDVGLASKEEQLRRAEEELKAEAEARAKAAAEAKKAKRKPKRAAGKDEL